MNSERALYDANLENVVKLPSVHIVGKEDDILPHSLALYELCNEGTASLIYHSKGHMIPRDQETVKVMARSIRTLINRAMFG